MPWIVPNPDYDPSKKLHFKYNNPYSVNLKSHDEALVENWNKMVPKGSNVYILGDFAWKDHNHFIMALNGRKYMIIGSHDKMNQDSLKNFTEVNKFGMRAKIQGQEVILSHCAFRVWEGSFKGFTWSLYGHSHGRLPEFDNMFSFDIGVDTWGYTPVPWCAVVEKIRLKKEWIAKHGKYPVDGETRADGQYDKDPDQRVIETRMKNKEIMRSLGYPIDDRMWPTEVLKWPSRAA